MRTAAAWYVAIPLQIAQTLVSLVSVVASLLRQARLMKLRTFRKARCVKPTLFFIVCAVLIITVFRPDLPADSGRRLTPLKQGLDIFRERPGSDQALHAAVAEGLAEDQSGPRLHLDPDGMLRGWDGIHEALESTPFWHSEKRKLNQAAATHPIEILIEQGQQRWKNLLANQSKSLSHAVGEYTRRYGRKPPKGFDQWWHFCKRNKVQIIDDVSVADETNVVAKLTFPNSTTRSTATSRPSSHFRPRRSTSGSKLSRACHTASEFFLIDDGSANVPAKFT